MNHPGENEGEVLVGEVVEDEGESTIQHTIREGFDKLTPTERRLMQQRGYEVQKRKRAARKLAELDAWAEAHREHAGELFNIKLDAIQGLKREATDEAGVFHPARLGDKGLRTLLNYITEFEKAGFKSEPKAPTTNTVNVVAILADLKKQLT